MQPVLATHHNHSSAAIALVCQRKGPQDLDVIKEVEQWLAQLGLMGLIRLRTDEEPSITSVAKQLAARRAGRTILELAPLKSPSSVGGVERKIQSVMAQVRTLVSAFEETYGTKLLAGHPLFFWMVRHASFLLERFQPLRNMLARLLLKFFSTNLIITHFAPLLASYLRRIRQRKRLPRWRHIGSLQCGKAAPSFRWNISA